MSRPPEQFHIAYDATQDRLLLRVTGSSAGEFRIWLTRRYSELMLNILVKLMDQSGGIRDIASHPSTLTLLRQGVFSQHAGPTVPDESFEPLPLGADGILGYSITYGRNQDGKINLKLMPAQGEGLDLDLDRTTLYLIYNLLEQGAAQADWRLQPAGRLKDPVH